MGWNAAPSCAPERLICKGNSESKWHRSARCYVDGQDAELWEGTRQVALLTRSNLPFLNSGGLLQLRARRRQAVCLGTINGRGGYLHVPGSPGTSVCDWPAL